MSLRVGDWSITPGSNTSVDGVFIGENCAVANLNNSDRAIMASVRYEVASFGANIPAGAAPDLSDVGGARSVTGVSTIAGFATAPAGLVRTLHFETATPIVPGANLSASFTSITTVKGDVMQVRSLGAGAWKVENFSRLTPIGKHKLWIPAVAMTPATTNGPASAQVVATDIQFYVLDFDQSTAENAHFNLGMPSSWNEGTITFVPLWTASSGTGGVTWNLAGYAIGDDDAIASSFSASVSSQDTLIATGDLHRGPESGPLTIDGTPAANDTVFFRVRRTVADANDTLTADARLIGIELYITMNEAVDVA